MLKKVKTLNDTLHRPPQAPVAVAGLGASTCIQRIPQLRRQMSRDRVNANGYRMRTNP